MATSIIDALDAEESTDRGAEEAAAEATPTNDEEEEEWPGEKEEEEEDWAILEWGCAG